MNKSMQQVLHFRDERNWKQYHTPNHIAKSLCIESSELLECFQFSEENYDSEHVQEELADIFIYGMMMADLCAFDLDEIIQKKLIKNALKYPKP